MATKSHSSTNFQWKPQFNGYKGYRSRSKHKFTAQSPSKLIFDITKELTSKLEKYDKTDSEQQQNQCFHLRLFNDNGNAKLCLILSRLPPNIKAIHVEYSMNLTMPLIDDFPCLIKHIFDYRSMQSKSINICSIDELEELVGLSFIVDVEITKLIHFSGKSIEPIQWKQYGIQQSLVNDEFEVISNGSIVEITKSNKNKEKNSLSGRLSNAEHEIKLLKQQNTTLQLAMMTLKRQMDKLNKQRTMQQILKELATQRNINENSGTITNNDSIDITSDKLSNPDSIYYSHQSTKDAFGTTTSDDNHILESINEIKECSTEDISEQHLMTETTFDAATDIATESKTKDEESSSILHCDGTKVMKMLKEFGFKALRSHYMIKRNISIIDEYHDIILEYFSCNELNNKLYFNRDDFAYNAVKYIGNRKPIKNVNALKILLSKLFLIIKSYYELYPNMNDHDENENNKSSEDEKIDNIKSTDFEQEDITTYQIKWKIKDLNKFLNITLGQRYDTKPIIINIEKYKIKFDFIIYPLGQMAIQKGFVQCILMLSELPKIIESITLYINIHCKYGITMRMFKAVNIFNQNDRFIGWDSYLLPLELIKIQNKMDCNELDVVCNLDILRIMMRSDSERYQNYHKPIDMNPITEFVWNIDKDLLSKMKYAKYGSVFYSNNFGNNCWSLKIKPNGTNYKDEGNMNISLILLRLGDNIDSVEVEYTLDIITSDNNWSENNKCCFSYRSSKSPSIFKCKTKWLSSLKTDRLTLKIRVETLQYIFD